MPLETIGRPMEILLVEDSLMAAKLAAQAVRFQQFDHRLTWISDGQEAMEFLAQEGRFSRAPAPDLILLDLILPGQSGIDILTGIRKSSNLAKIPVIIMTGEARSEQDHVLDTLGVEAYLTKPFQAAEFETVVKQLRGHWRTHMLRPSQDDQMLPPTDLL
ncbi:MAG: response regulator [Planctomycetaceae bacterium]